MFLHILFIIHKYCFDFWWFKKWAIYWITFCRSGRAKVLVCERDYLSTNIFFLICGHFSNGWYYYRYQALQDASLFLRLSLFLFLLSSFSLSVSFIFLSCFCFHYLFALFLFILSSVFLSVSLSLYPLSVTFIICLSFCFLYVSIVFRFLPSILDFSLSEHFNLFRADNNYNRMADQPIEANV